MHAYKFDESLSVEELKTKLFKTSRPKSALMIKEACDKKFFILEKKGRDNRKKYVLPTPEFINEFSDYLKVLSNLSF